MKLLNGVIGESNLRRYIKIINFNLIYLGVIFVILSFFDLLLWCNSQDIMFTSSYIFIFTLAIVFCFNILFLIDIVFMLVGKRLIKRGSECIKYDAKSNIFVPISKAVVILFYTISILPIFLLLLLFIVSLDIGIVIFIAIISTGIIMSCILKWHRKIYYFNINRLNTVSWFLQMAIFCILIVLNVYNPDFIFGNKDGNLTNRINEQQCNTDDIVVKYNTKTWISSYTSYRVTDKKQYFEEHTIIQSNYKVLIDRFLEDKLKEEANVSTTRLRNKLIYTVPGVFQGWNQYIIVDDNEVMIIETNLPFTVDEIEKLKL